jgi:hypothetical protein
MANHGYIPRNGVASVVELTLASNKVYGMGHDLAGFLSAYSGIMSGDLTSVSIGGAPLGLIDSIGGTLGLLGKPQGLSGSHNRFEADASPTRADLYTRYVPSLTCVPFSHNKAFANTVPYQRRRRQPKPGAIRTVGLHAQGSKRL